MFEGDLIFVEKQKRSMKLIENNEENVEKKKIDMMISSNATDLLDFDMNNEL